MDMTNEPSQKRQLRRTVPERREDALEDSTPAGSGGVEKSAGGGCAGASQGLAAAAGFASVGSGAAVRTVTSGHWA